MYRCTLIISFYNKIDWLELVLAALQRQTVSDFEIIIADDGSSSEVVARVHDVQQRLPLHLRHLWHPDRGFMKTIMLNKAVMAAQSDYLIFIDGDCIPHKSFVEDHCRLRKPKQILAGRRVNLSDALSKSLTTHSILKGKLECSFVMHLFLDSLLNGSKDVEKGIHVTSNFINTQFASTRKGLLGCNFSVYKQDLLEVNGFDERYQHPGVGEDTEIEYRLKLNGCVTMRPKFCLVQYHLWHKRLSREQETDNLKLFAETREMGYIKSPYGISKLEG